MKKKKAARLKEKRATARLKKKRANKHPAAQEDKRRLDARERVRRDEIRAANKERRRELIKAANKDQRKDDDKKRQKRRRDSAKAGRSHASHCASHLGGESRCNCNTQLLEESYAAHRNKKKRGNHMDALRTFPHRDGCAFVKDRFKGCSCSRHRDALERIRDHAETLAVPPLSAEEMKTIVIWVERQTVLAVQGGATKAEEGESKRSEELDNQGVLWRCRLEEAVIVDALGLCVNKEMVNIVVAGVMEGFKGRGRKGEDWDVDDSGRLVGPAGLSLLLTAVALVYTFVRVAQMQGTGVACGRNIIGWLVGAGAVRGTLGWMVETGGASAPLVWLANEGSCLDYHKGLGETLAYGRMACRVVLALADRVGDEHGAKDGSSGATVEALVVGMFERYFNNEELRCEVWEAAARHLGNGVNTNSAVLKKARYFLVLAYQNGDVEMGLCQDGLRVILSHFQKKSMLECGVVVCGDLIEALKDERCFRVGAHALGVVCAVLDVLKVLSVTEGKEEVVVAMREGGWEQIVENLASWGERTVDGALAGIAENIVDIKTRRSGRRTIPTEKVQNVREVKEEEARKEEKGAVTADESKERDRTRVAEKAAGEGRRGKSQAEKTRGKGDKATAATNNTCGESLQWGSRDACIDGVGCLRSQLRQECEIAHDALHSYSIYRMRTNSVGCGGAAVGTERQPGPDPAAGASATMQGNQGKGVEKERGEQRMRGRAAAANLETGEVGVEHQRCGMDGPCFPVTRGGRCSCSGAGNGAGELRLVCSGVPSCMRVLAREKCSRRLQGTSEGCFARRGGHLDRSPVSSLITGEVSSAGHWGREDDWKFVECTCRDAAQNRHCELEESEQGGVGFGEQGSRLRGGNLVGSAAAERSEDSRPHLETKSEHEIMCAACVGAVQGLAEKLRRLKNELKAVQEELKKQISERACDVSVRRGLVCRVCSRVSGGGKEQTEGKERGLGGKEESDTCRSCWLTTKTQIITALRAKETQLLDPMRPTPSVICGVRCAYGSLKSAVSKDLLRVYSTREAYQAMERYKEATSSDSFDRSHGCGCCGTAMSRGEALLPTSCLVWRAGRNNLALEGYMNTALRHDEACTHCWGERHPRCPFRVMSPGFLCGGTYGVLSPLVHPVTPYILNKTGGGRSTTITVNESLAARREYKSRSDYDVLFDSLKPKKPASSTGPAPLVGGYAWIDSAGEMSGTDTTLLRKARRALKRPRPCASGERGEPPAVRRLLKSWRGENGITNKFERERETIEAVASVVGSMMLDAREVAERPTGSGGDGNAEESVCGWLRAIAVAVENIGPNLLLELWDLIWPLEESELASPRGGEDAAESCTLGIGYFFDALFSDEAVPYAKLGRIPWVRKVRGVQGGAAAEMRGYARLCANAFRVGRFRLICCSTCRSALMKGCSPKFGIFEHFRPIVPVMMQERWVDSLGKEGISRPSVPLASCARPFQRVKAGTENVEGGGAESKEGTHVGLKVLWRDEPCVILERVAGQDAEDERLLRSNQKEVMGSRCNLVSAKDDEEVNGLHTRVFGVWPTWMAGVLRDTRTGRPLAVVQPRTRLLMSVLSFVRCMFEVHRVESSSAKARNNRDGVSRALNDNPALNLSSIR